MKSTDNVEIGLVSMECVGAIGDERDVPKMLERAFKAAKNHWMVPEVESQLKGALNAVLTKMGDDHPERNRLEIEIRLLGQFNAFIRAAQSGLHVDPPQLPEGFEAFGIMGIWHATVA